MKASRSLPAEAVSFLSPVLPPASTAPRSRHITSSRSSTDPRMCIGIRGPSSAIARPPIPGGAAARSAAAAAAMSSPSPADSSSPMVSGCE